MKKWLCMLLAAALLAGVNTPALAMQEEESDTAELQWMEEASPEEYLGHAQAGYDPFSDGMTYSTQITHNTRYARYNKLEGIDVSEFQGTIDWAKVAADGVEFAIIRIGGRFSQTGLFYDDGKFIENIKGALANGIEVGVYFFSQAITEQEAIEEANRTLSLLGSYASKLTLPVFLDVEYVNGGGRLYNAKLSTSQQTAIAKAYCKTIANAGLEAGVYASFLSFGISASELTSAGYAVWHAHWNTSTSLSAWYDVWQFSDTGTVKGISKAVDMNIWYRANCLTAFTDVNLSYWYVDSVRYVVENKLFYGMSDTSFAPDSPMTREMFVTVLYRMAGSPAAGGTSGFSDVKNSSTYYYNAVCWAAANNLVNGMGDGSFGVGRSITRQEMAVFMMRYAAWKGLNVTASSSATSGFADQGSIASWAKDAMNWAVAKGIMVGMSGTELSPGGTTTRAQVAAVLMRLAGLT